MKTLLIMIEDLMKVITQLITIALEFIIEIIAILITIIIMYAAIHAIGYTFIKLLMEVFHLNISAALQDSINDLIGGILTLGAFFGYVWVESAIERVEKIKGN